MALKHQGESGLWILQMDLPTIMPHALCLGRAQGKNISLSQNTENIIRIFMIPIFHKIILFPILMKLFFFIKFIVVKLLLRIIFS